MRTHSYTVSAWLCLMAASLAHSAAAAGHLVVEAAWIRAAPPGAMMLAGYARLRNDGDAPLGVNTASSPDFESVSLHETVEEGGVARMRAPEELRIAPGASVAFAPGGKHLMLMRPRRELQSGDTVKIRLDAGPAQSVTAEFVVRAEVP